MTPRKLHALLKVHIDLKRKENGHEEKKKEQTINGYIDTIPGW